MPICKNNECQKSFPNWAVVNGKKRNLNSRKYCLECVAFGTHNTRPIFNPSYRKIDTSKFCHRCETNKPVNEFYRRRSGTECSSYCKICSIEQVSERKNSFKQNCIQYCGGKCQICGYNKCSGALEFHHKDPTQKDFTIAHVQLTKFSDKIKKELDKCTMLCANCHREEHSRIFNTSTPI